MYTANYEYTLCDVSVEIPFLSVVADNSENTFIINNKNSDIHFNITKKDNVFFIAGNVKIKILSLPSDFEKGDIEDFLIYQSDILIRIIHDIIKSCPAKYHDVLDNNFKFDIVNMKIINTHFK